MKKIVIILSFTCFIYFPEYAQPIIEWEKKVNFGYQDNLLDFIQLVDGSFLGIGSTALNFQDKVYDYSCYKFDCRGNITWVKKFPDRIFNFESLQIDSLGSNKLAIYGEKIKDTTYRSTGFITIIDTAGKILKTKEFSGNGYVTIKKIILNDDETLTVLVNSTASDGIFQGNKGFHDIWLWKMDRDLNIIFKQNFGGPSIDFAGSIIKLKDGNYILAGGTSSRDGDFKAVYSGGDAFVAKLNRNFDILWSTTFGGNRYESVNDVIEMPDRSFIVSGYTDSYDGAFQGQPKGFYSDAFVARINPSGSVSWVKGLGADRVRNPQYVIWAPTLIPIDSNSFLVNTNGKTDEGLLNNKFSVTWLLKMNTLGETIWKKNYGNSKLLYTYKSNKIKQLSDKSFLLVGESEDSGSVGKDFWLLKLSPLEPDKTDECSKLVLYPNPTAKDLKIKTSAYFLPNASVKVIDVLGRNIFSGVIGKGCQEFNVALPNSISTGMYFLKVEDIKKCVLPFFKAN